MVVFASRLKEAGLGQGKDAARGERRLIDRPAWCRNMHIWAALVNLNSEATLTGPRARGPLSPAPIRWNDFWASSSHRRTTELSSAWSPLVRSVVLPIIPGKNFLSSVSFKYDEPELPPVPMRTPITRSTSWMWRSLQLTTSSSNSVSRSQTSIQSRLFRSSRYSKRTTRARASNRSRSLEPWGVQYRSLVTHRRNVVRDGSRSLRSSRACASGVGFEIHNICSPFNSHKN